ncbi:hypothetical protein GJ744_008043 [Endocarpon pusillum]|uniref:FAD/NAD(P)-binding domain-containing protein n=1 Tax=Endocarpon pusillum TaxID=364733 RepID=A0A8H7AQU5_9EURO|nr:hypothetical protein GJ744_008043 [Endocarpon pusillum]
MDPVPEEAIHHERKIRIICIGAGASGLCLAYKLQRSFRRFTLMVYEKNAEISGTWYENRYPGCACDIPAHNYTYSFEPKPDWSKLYASSHEIKGYFNDFSSKYGLIEYIKIRHKVNEAQWREAEGTWKVAIEDLDSGQIFDDYCDILINAGGYLNHWQWPDVPGLHEYEGQLLHSANWDVGVELRGKKVGLIGNGSSAVQILPQIQPEVDCVTNFIRSPVWIVPTIGDSQHTYTRHEIENFVTNPRALMSVRKKNETVTNSIFSVYLRGSKLQNESKIQLTSDMKGKLRNKTLEDKLIPAFSVGCRRLTPDAGYLVALTKENVHVVHQGVASFTTGGCKSDDGTEHLLDIIICATGFNTSFRPRFPIVGLDGKNLQDVWTEQPKSYLGIAISGFPNLLTLLGPNSPVGNGPTLSAIEAQTDHILQMIDRYQTENIHSFYPKAEAVDDFAAHVRDFMQKSVWTEDCRSGYKNHSVDDRIPTLWPGSTLHCLEALRELRADDWDIRYNGNRFAWLGNGISQTEFDATSDLAYYIRDRDDSPFASRRRRREVLSRSGTQPPRELHKTHRPTDVSF